MDVESASVYKECLNNELRQVEDIWLARGLEEKWKGVIQAIIKSGEETLGEQKRSCEKERFDDKSLQVVLERNDVRNLQRKT